MVAMNSFGIEQEWQQGIDKDDLFKRTCYISKLLFHESFIRERINETNRGFFDVMLKKML